MKTILLIVLFLQTLSLFQYVELKITHQIIYEEYTCYKYGGGYDGLSGHGHGSGNYGNDGWNGNNEGKPRPGKPGVMEPPGEPGQPGSPWSAGIPGRPGSNGKEQEDDNPDDYKDDDDDHKIPIRKITRNVSSEIDYLCTLPQKGDILKATYNLTTFKNKRVMEVTFDNLETSVSRHNGNEFYTQYGQVRGGICDGSYIYIANPCYDHKETSRSSCKGSKWHLCPYSFIIFKGDKCDLFCSGYATVHFNPSIKCD